VHIIYVVLEILLAPIAIVNFSIGFLGSLAALGLTWNSPLLLQLVALGMGIMAWVMNAGTATISADRPILVRLLWLPGMSFSILAVFVFYFSIPNGESFSWEVLRRPELLSQKSMQELLIATAFAVVTAASPMGVAWLDIRRNAN